MIFTKYSNTLRWFIIAASFAIVSLILWKTYEFFQHFKDEERTKMENWSFAQSDLLKTDNLDGNIGELSLKVITSNKTTPMIKANTDGSFDFNNIDESKVKDSAYIQKLIFGPNNFFNSRSF